MIIIVVIITAIINVSARTDLGILVKQRVLLNEKS